MTESSVLLALVDASVRALIIAAVIGGLLFVVRVRSGSVAHAAWMLVMLAMLALPILPKWLPALPQALPQPAALATTLMAPDPPPSVPVSATVSIDRAAPASQPTAAPATTSPAGSSAAPARARMSWTEGVLTAWIAGAVLMFVRLAGGWRYARRLATGSRPVENGVSASPLVATPVAVGVLSPRIIVPESWSSWPDDVREAVLAHEQAHVRRRDMLVNLLAHINRCVFWFHPLAWWLERRIATTAEQACDDEVVRRSGLSARYAAVLVEMATSLSTHGGRVAWHGVGIIGRRALGDRIDRILDGVGTRTVTRTRRIAVIALAATIIVPAVACQQSPPDLRENPDLAAQFKRDRERRLEIEAMKNLDRAGLAALEAQVAKNPDDLELTAKLIHFYREHGQKLIGWNEMVAARRPHLLRLIEKHPDSNYTGWPLPQRLDPDGWAKARALWMAHLSSPSVTPKILGQAARFFGISEKPVAEEILLRAMQGDPNGPQPRVVSNTYYSPWSNRLGELYARAIVGSDDDTLFNVVRSVSLEEANGPFATAAKKKLVESKDPALLRAAGSYLTQNARSWEGKIGDQKIALGFNHRELGESYLDRAAALDPDSETTRQFEAYRRQARLHEANYRLIQEKAGGWDRATPEQFATLPTDVRIDLLPSLGAYAVMAAESAENSTDRKAEFRPQMERARAFADQGLTLAASLKADPRAAALAFTAHMTRGIVAIREGDRALAVSHLKAGGSLAHAALVDGEGAGMWPRLTNYLLKDGERETVATFMDQMAQAHSGKPPYQKRFAAAATAIRAGMMPDSYQRQMTER